LKNANQTGISVEAEKVAVKTTGGKVTIEL
jgi:hypothetical protein